MFIVVAGNQAFQCFCTDRFDGYVGRVISLNFIVILYANASVCIISIQVQVVGFVTSNTCSVIRWRG